MADFAFTRRDDFGMAAIMARKGIGAEQIGAALGGTAPTGPRRSIVNDDVGLIGSGDGAWLAYREAVPPFWADTLRERLGSIASVSDQSGAYTIFRLSGEDARTVLQRGAAIDLHPNVFGPGAAACTVIAYIGVIIWTAGDQDYDVAVYRSFVDSFQHWLEESAAAL